MNTNSDEKSTKIDKRTDEDALIIQSLLNQKQPTPPTTDSKTTSIKGNEEKKITPVHGHKKNQILPFVVGNVRFFFGAYN